MKKFIVFFLMCAVLTAHLFAGGKTENADAPIVIDHWYWVPNADIPRYQEMIDEFNKTHSDIQVKWENIPMNDVRTKFISAFAVGQGPDTFGMPSAWVPEFTAMGMLEPLDKYITSWPNKEEIFPNLYDIANIDGEQFGLPWKLLVTYMYYRADWFKEAGIEPPNTVDEFLTVSKKITGKYANEKGEQIDRYGYGLRGGPGGGSSFFIWVLNYGAKLYDEKGNVAFDSPIAVEAVQKYIDMFRKDKIVPPSAVGDGFAQIIGAFKSGNTAMLNHHIGTYVEIQQALGDKVGVIMYPAGPNGNRWNENSVISHGISSISTKKDAAFRFISWLSEDWAVEHQSRYLGSIPITKNVANLPYFRDNRFYSVSNEAIPYTHNWPQNTTWANILDNLAVKWMQQALMGEITAQQLVKNVSTALAEK